MDFKEDFLQLVWKYQYFDRKNLTTTDGQALEILQAGHSNALEGPDFRNASVAIGGIAFHGHVEVHRKASEWKQHAHDADPAYNPVVLHLVWENDRQVYRQDGAPMPTVELKGKIYLDIWRNYQQLLNFQLNLPCAHAMATVPEILRFSASEKALVERLHEKSQEVLAVLQATKGDWEETAYRWLFRCFGYHTNRLPMEELGQLLPYTLLKRHREQLQHLEAMLLGQAGLLPEDSEDPYVQQLKKDHDFYQKKYGWSTRLSRQHWTFLGARPANFPTLRLAQLASILAKSPHLFSTILDESGDLGTFRKMVQSPPSPYWRQHYTFGKPSSKTTSNGLSEQSMQLLLINFVLPIWFAYGEFHDQEEWKERCFSLLQSLPAEQNYVLRKFVHHAWKPSTAFDSQGMLELYRSYCSTQKCLSCKIGQSLVRSPSK
uniref:DUF2851 family protein n=1 Tax=Algoriphagus sp. TaxID=1872435 RepID=UPI004047E7B4